MRGATSRLVLGTLALLLAASCRLEVALEERPDPQIGRDAGPAAAERFVLSDAEWRRRLTSEQYFVLREGGDESAFTGAYWGRSEPGTYHCAGCGQILFDSGAKLETETGWPAFRAPIDPRRVRIDPDGDGGSGARVRCARCGGYLGHRVREGAPSTAPHYRINSAALRFVSEDEEEE